MEAMEPLKETTLRGSHVVLEPLRPDHADELWPSAQEQEIWRYMPIPVHTRAEFAAWIEARIAPSRNGTALPFLQRDARTGVAFGSTSLFEIDREFLRAEIGHTWIARSHRRTAANTEAKLLLLAHAFEGLGMARVQFKCDARNAPSEAAILRLGATKEGVLRSFMVLRDGFHRDTCIFSILRSEWPPVRSRLEARLDLGKGH